MLGHYTKCGLVDNSTIVLCINMWWSYSITLFLNEIFASIFKVLRLWWQVKLNFKFILIHSLLVAGSINSCAVHYVFMQESNSLQTQSFLNFSSKSKTASILGQRLWCNVYKSWKDCFRGCQNSSGCQNSTLVLYWPNFHATFQSDLDILQTYNNVDTGQKCKVLHFWQASKLLLSAYHRW